MGTPKNRIFVAQRRIHPVVRMRLSLWILRCAQNDRNNLAGQTPDKSGDSFVQTVPSGPLRDAGKGVSR
jgi:hypothetical protein